VDEALAEYQAAVRLSEEQFLGGGLQARAHTGLALALADKGRFEEAIAEWREALRLIPNDAWVRKNFAITLGKWAWQYQQPDKQLYAAAALHYAEAFATDPKVGDDPNTFRRYNAACAAALAGCGQGKDAAALGEQERARLRRQALDWLQADLAAWQYWHGVLNVASQAKDADKTRSLVRQQMEHWQQDGDFAGVRGVEALARLPQAERRNWEKLWQSVQALASKAAAAPAPGPPTQP
jgi:hypothetical protein